MAELTRETLGQMRLAAQQKLWQQEAQQQRLTRAVNVLRGVVQPAPKAIYTANAWGVDLSHWDANVNQEAMKAVDFLIVKMGGSDGGDIYLDATFADRVQLAWNIDVPVIAYWFEGPYYWIANQRSLETLKNINDASNPILQTIISQLHAGGGWKAVWGLLYDVEEASVDATKQVTPPWLMWDVKKNVEGLRKIGHPHLQQGVYSRQNFMEGATAPGRDLSVYLGTQQDMYIHEARWVSWPGEITTLADMKANHRPADTAKPAGFGWCATRAQPWQFWQYNGEMLRTNEVTNANGLPMAIDLNLFNGTREQLYSWLGFVPHGSTPQPEPEPEPEPNPDIAALTARVAALEREIDIIERPGAWTSVLNKPAG